MSHENTQQKQAGAIGGKASGDRKRRDMSKKSRRQVVQETSGISDRVNVGYEIGLGREMNRACNVFFKGRGIPTYEYKPYY